MTMGVWQSVDRLYMVQLSDRVLREISKLARKSAPLEIGTPLIGEYSDDQRTAYVLSTGPIPPDSTRHRFAFQRGISGLNSLFSSLFRETNGRRHYVGEWHSHPGGAPIPSSTDDENMFAIASDPKNRCPECILVIASVISDDVSVRVYVYSRRGSRADLTEQRHV